jgi:hypothetical protein
VKGSIGGEEPAESKRAPVRTGLPQQHRILIPWNPIMSTRSTISTGQDLDSGAEFHLYRDTLDDWAGKDQIRLRLTEVSFTAFSGELNEVDVAATRKIAPAVRRCRRLPRRRSRREEHRVGRRTSIQPAGATPPPVHASP